LASLFIETGVTCALRHIDQAVRDRYGGAVRIAEHIRAQSGRDLDIAVSHNRGSKKQPRNYCSDLHGEIVIHATFEI